MRVVSLGTERAGCLLLGLAGMCIVGCGTDRAQAEMHSLRRAVQSLRAQVARQDARIEDLKNELIVVRQGITATAAQTTPPEVPPSLEVVRLVPERRDIPEAQPPRAEEPPPATITMGSDGELRLSQSGESPRATPSARQIGRAHV